jgi:hypothetical protein
MEKVDEEDEEDEDPKSKNTGVRGGDDHASMMDQIMIENVDSAENGPTNNQEEVDAKTSQFEILKV